MSPEIELFTKLAGTGGGGALLIGAMWIYFTKKAASDKAASDKSSSERLSFGTRLDSIDKTLAMLSATVKSIDDRGNRVELFLVEFKKEIEWIVSKIKEIMKMLEVRDPKNNSLIWYKDMDLPQKVDKMADSVTLLTKSIGDYIVADEVRMGNLVDVLKENVQSIHIMKSKLQG